MKYYNKVKRYGMVTRHWYDDESWEEIGEKDHGEFVTYNDYKKLLDEKSPKRQASIKEISTKIKGHIKTIKDDANEIFLKKNEVNYDYAIGQHMKADELKAALDAIKLLFDN